MSIKEILKTYKDTVLDIKANLIIQDKETQTYLDDEAEYLSEFKK